MGESAGSAGSEWHGGDKEAVEPLAGLDGPEDSCARNSAEGAYVGG